MKQRSFTRPFWWPDTAGWLAIGLYCITLWLLYILSPAKGEEPSELFKLLAQAVVLTAFVNGVVAAAYTASRDGSKKNETINNLAKATASGSATAETVAVTGENVTVKESS